MQQLRFPGIGKGRQVAPWVRLDPEVEGEVVRLMAEAMVTVDKAKGGKDNERSSIEPQDHTTPSCS